jgi:hypothetical protein
MASNPNPNPTENVSQGLTVKDAVRAPIIYFEGVPTCGYNNGIVNLLLAVGVVLPTPDGRTITEPVAVAHLRCNVIAAQALRDTIDKALLLATPVPEGKAN